MAILQVNKQTEPGAGDNATAHAITLSFTPTAGNLLVLKTAFRDEAGAQGVGVTFPGGTSLVGGAAFATTWYVQMNYKISDGTETEFTAETTFGCNSIFSVSEYSGLDMNQATVLEDSSVKVVESTEMSHTTDTVTTTAGSSLVIALLSPDFNLGPITTSWTNLFTQQLADTPSTGSPQSRVTWADLITSMPGNYFTTLEWTNLRRVASVVGAFREPLPPGGRGGGGAGLKSGLSLRM